MVEHETSPDSAAAGGEPEGLGGLVADVVRKAVLAGAGALFLTEESARKLAREWKLPKELAAFLVTQAQGAKDEVLRIVSAEIRRFLQSEAFRREILGILGSMTLEVNAEIHLGHPRGRRRTQVSVRPRARRPTAGDPEAEEP